MCSSECFIIIITNHAVLITHYQAYTLFKRIPSLKYMYSVPSIHVYYKCNIDRFLILKCRLIRYGDENLDIKYRPKCYDDENLVINSLDELSVHVQNSLACMYTTCLKRYKNSSIDATTFDKMVHFKCIFRMALLLETQMAVLEMRQQKKCRDNILIETAWLAYNP